MDSYAETSSGLLLIADGFDPVLVWDGQEAQAQPAGLAAPTQAPVISGSGIGGIVGTYTAYVRFVDSQGFYSNLSPISNSFVAQSSGATGNIQAASFTAPIKITSANHGLSTGNTVLVSGVSGNTSANGLWIITVVDVNNFTLNGSSGNAVYTGSGTWQAGISTINYNNVQVTTDPKVVRRQILRNLDGEATTYYVDIDTTDLTSIMFSSTKVDSILAAQEAQPILDANGLPLANLRGIPPNWKTTLCAHLDRMFMAGQYDEERGSAIVTAGSLIVQGVGTDWVSGLANRFFYVVGASNNYQIASVDVLNQQLTLTSPYADQSDNFAVYAIRPPPAERKLVYYTPASQPESWPPTYALQIQEDDDEITALMARGSFLYILERRHIYKLTFQDDPAQDGAIFLSANRGCINNRCWSIVDGDAYMLDEYGCHKFSSTGQIEPLSQQIQEMFRPGSLYKFQINWKASRWFFSVVSRPNDIIRWFVALGGDYIPHHAICYNYRLQRWWIEQYPFSVGGGVAGHINKVPYVFLVGENAGVYAMWQGTSDLVDPSQITLRGNQQPGNWVTDSPIDSLTNPSMLSTTGTNGRGSGFYAPLTIVDGRGKGQTRRIVDIGDESQAGFPGEKTIFVEPPWTITPDATSVYQIGGVVWNWKSTWFRLSVAENMAQRAIELLFLTASQPCTMDFRTRQDFGDPDVQRQSFTSKQGGGVRTDKNLPDKVVDLTVPNGLVLIQQPGHRERFVNGRRYLQIELAGATNQDPVSVFEITVDGMGNAAVISQDQ